VTTAAISASANEQGFGLILNLAAAVGAQMPATRALSRSTRTIAQGQEQDFSAVILEMESKLIWFRGQWADSVISE